MTLLEVMVQTGSKQEVMGLGIGPYPLILSFRIYCSYLCDYGGDM